MARPPAPQTWTTRPRRSRHLGCIAIVLLASIVLVGLAVLITWLVVRPKRLTYTIENGSIHGFDLTDNQLNATFDIILRSHNPNHRVSVYYDSMEVAVSYHEQTLAFDVVQPFLQPHRNFTRIEAKPVARSVSLLGSVAKELRNDKGSGELKLDVRVKAKIRFKMGLWKSGKRTLRVLCSDVVLPMSSSTNFERTYCDIDI